MLSYLPLEGHIRQAFLYLITCKYILSKNKLCEKHLLILSDLIDIDRSES